MLKFEPFQNDHQSMQIGELIFENQTDKIIIYGDIDIKKTEEGLAQALKLQTLFDEIVNKLQDSTLESVSENGVASNSTSTNDISSKEVENPFS